jgi:hypothetical protein
VIGLAQRGEDLEGLQVITETAEVAPRKHQRKITKQEKFMRPLAKL